MEYDDELNFVINYENRNKFIANLADKLDGNTLTIIRFIEKHANILKDYYDAKNNKKTYLITGDTSHEDKTLIKENMEFETNANLMGSWGLVSTGMSIVNLHNGIFASPSASEIRVLQAIGRILRKGKNKTTATQYDIIDDFTYEGRYNHMMRHFMKRLQYYRKEGFDIEIIKVNIK
jgi:superfamily II DNA or RNA helicase